MGLAIEKSTGAAHAYLATPASAADSDAENVSSPAILSDEARAVLQKMRFGTFGRR